MSITQLFKDLGAPLQGSQRSWGAVRVSDGVYFLKVWQDHVRQSDGRLLARLTFRTLLEDQPDDPAFQERLRWIEAIQQGARCYMVMCEAEDVKAKHRKIKNVDADDVFPGGTVGERDGDFWLELLPRVPMRDVK